MKFLFSLCAIAVVSSGSNNISLSEVFDDIPELPTMEDVYGRTRQMRITTKPRRGGMSSRRTLDNCTFPLEIVIIQDSTASFEDDFGNMRDVQLDLMVDALSVGHPDSTFGVVSFRDKPVYSLGEPAAGDYCLRFEAPLSANVTALKTVYETLTSNGGADPSEAQFTAIVAAAQSATPGWSSKAAADVTRLIVVATDAPPHFADDGLNSYGMTPFSGTFDELDADTQCLSEYYPSPAQVMSALNARDAYLAVLVFDGAYWNELPHKSWVWFNDFIGQRSEFVTSLTSDSSNFWANLNHVIRTIEQMECVEPATSTTTPAPETSACPPCEVAPCHPCGPPAVQILLQDRPSHLRLQVDNDDNVENV